MVSLADILYDTKKIFISFDYENDRHYKHLLTAISNNRRFSLNFSDSSSKEINSNSIDRVKAALSCKIKDSTHTLIIIGKHANSRHKDHKLIGYRNWINFEVAKSKEFKNKLIAVKLHPHFDSPEELLGAGASWVKSFDIDNITKVISNY